MADKEKLRAETSAMLRAVLISSPRGVPFEKLYRDYRQLTGKAIPYKELGFAKLENFIQDIPDVARAERGPDGTWTLKGVASDADKHVAKLISKQKKPKVRKSAKSFARKPASYRNPPVKFHSPVKAPSKPNRPPVRLPQKFQWASNGMPKLFVDAIHNITKGLKSLELFRPRSRLSARNSRQITWTEV